MKIQLPEASATTFGYRDRMIAASFNFTSKQTRANEYQRPKHVVIGEDVTDGHTDRY